MFSKPLHEDAVFENVNYSGKEIKGTEFENCSFKNCNFSGAILNAAAFIECSFAGCDLSMMRLPDCRMNGVTFKGCKMLGVNFSECVDFLFAIGLADCMADYSSYVRKKMTKMLFAGTSLKGADFTGADLSGAEFPGCNLEDAVFAATICREADFSTAVNYIIDPEQNSIRRAKFSTAGLTGLLAKYTIRVVD
jgi:uncharacterized protein YjbI with pentapeptide repeats